MDTFMPSFMPCFSVSEITNVNSGPGDRPALSPKTTPENKKVIRGAMKLQRWVKEGPLLLRSSYIKFPICLLGLHITWLDL